MVNKLQLLTMEFHLILKALIVVVYIMAVMMKMHLIMKILMVSFIKMIRLELMSRIQIY